MSKEDWKANTPEALVPSSNIRKMFDEGVWKCSWLTQNLCFAALHPEDKYTDVGKYQPAFLQYRLIIGPQATGEFDRNYQLATAPAIFHAYMRAMDAGIRTEIRRLFADLLKIAIAHAADLTEHPAEWAKSHLSRLIGGQKHGIVTWIKSVCDRQDLLKPFSTEQEREDFIFWTDWRAPKLIYMQPSGNLPYDATSAWSREDEKKTHELLESLSSRFTQFLGFGLDKLVGDAHIALAQLKLAPKESPLTKPHSNDDRDFAQMAIEEARKSAPEDARPHPKVGAIVVKDGKVLSKAHRGEKTKSHAEYIALDEKLTDDLVAGATVYTTLEPCTTRKHPKIPCAQRLIDRRVARVVIGMLDPNPDIRGRGESLLNDAGIEVQLFPRDLRSQIEDMNREFIRAQKQRDQTKVGLTASADSQFLEQRAKVPDSEFVRKIWSKPHWRIWIRSSEFKPARFQTLEQCRQFILSSAVTIRGWFPYPSFSRDGIEVGSEWIVCESESPTRTMKKAERWLLYRSGQFTDNRSLEQILQVGDRVHVIEILDMAAAVLEFAARMSDWGVLGPEAMITWELHGVAGRSLTWPQDQIGDVNAVPRNSWCQDEAVRAERRVPTDELKFRARESALEVAQEIYSSFRWPDPPIERLRSSQDQRFGAK